MDRLRRARRRQLITSKPMESKTKPDGSGTLDGAELLVTGVLKIRANAGSIVLVVSIPMQY
jgi:hypothetical protein